MVRRLVTSLTTSRLYIRDVAVFKVTAFQNFDPDQLSVRTFEPLSTHCRRTLC